MVKLWHKAAEGPAEAATKNGKKAAQRAERLPTSDLLSWAEVLTSEVGRGIDAIRKNEPDALAEFALTMEGLTAVGREIGRRL